ncbi:hypothetical protein, partial [Rothia mucilaginosa]|uniref:hypothetical protein n=1 Tax=Rothia mucilaginosa TaxID=43675 RepID=UPI0019554897
EATCVSKSHFFGGCSKHMWLFAVYGGGPVSARIYAAGQLLCPVPIFGNDLASLAMVKTPAQSH